MLLKNKVVYLSFPNTAVGNLLREEGASVTNNRDTSVDLVVLPGGADITPFLYGERPAEHTAPMFYRDMSEMKTLRHFPFGTPMLGICRGAQLLCINAGGSLWQHCNNHQSGFHETIDEEDGEIFRVNTLHHQQMILPTHAHKLLTANESTEKWLGSTRHYIKEAGRKDNEDVEAAFIPYHNYLCLQFHPEMATRNSDSYKAFAKYVKKYLHPVFMDRSYFK